MVAQTDHPVSKLNPTQMHLLHLFSKNMSEKELKDLKKLLVEWYDERTQEEADRLWEERGMSSKTMEKVLKTRFRSPANS